MQKRTVCKAMLAAGASQLCSLVCPFGHRRDSTQDGLRADRGTPIVIAIADENQCTADATPFGCVSGNSLISKAADAQTQLTQDFTTIRHGRIGVEPGRAPQIIFRADISPCQPLRPLTGNRREASAINCTRLRAAPASVEPVRLPRLSAGADVT